MNELLTAEEILEKKFFDTGDKLRQNELIDKIENLFASKTPLSLDQIDPNTNSEKLALEIDQIVKQNSIDEKFPDAEIQELKRFSDKLTESQTTKKKERKKSITEARISNIASKREEINKIENSKQNNEEFASMIIRHYFDEIGTLDFGTEDIADAITRALSNNKPLEEAKVKAAKELIEIRSSKLEGLQAHQPKGVIEKLKESLTGPKYKKQINKVKEEIAYLEEYVDLHRELQEGVIKDDVEVEKNAA
jgi:hypothetical protein